MLIDPELLDRAFPPGTRKRLVVKLWLRAQAGELGIKVPYTTIAKQAGTTQQCVKNVVSELRSWLRNLAAGLAEEQPDLTKLELVRWLIQILRVYLDPPGWLGLGPPGGGPDLPLLPPTLPCLLLPFSLLLGRATPPVCLPTLVRCRCR